MKAKNLFSLIGIFALILVSLSIVNAQSFSVSSSTLLIREPASSSAFTISATTPINISFPSAVTTDIEGTPQSFSITGDGQNITTARQFTVTNQSPIDYSKFKLGRVYSNSFTLSDAANSSNNQTITLQIESTFCDAGNAGVLTISDFNIDNFGEGSDDEWQPLDEISIEVEAENIGTDRVNDVTLEIVIVDSAGNDVTDDFDLDEDSIDLGNINDDTRESAIFTISQLPADIDEDNYRVYVKVFEDGNETGNCADNFNDIREIRVIKEDNNAVVIRNLPITITGNQGDTVEISLSLFNIGTRDEDQVLVTLTNTELGIALDENFRNLDVGDRQDLIFLVRIPETATPKTYSLRLVTFFDYDDGDVFNPSSYDLSSIDDLDVTYSVSLNVNGTPISVTPTVTAELDSDAVEGENLVIKTTIKNNGNSGNFVITLTGYESWAELLSIEPQIFDLAKDATEEITITLKPTKAGEQTFTIKTTNNGNSFDKPVAVAIEEKAGNFLSSITGAFAGLGTLEISLISGIILLVIIIIVVAIVKLSSSKRKEEF